ncbi:MAG TPA: hypothetical protein VNE60_08875 [Gemmatimonadaceae bacterium]|nr:hypothetical protein [Gemmatimonadaceae bacterium]
MNTPFLLQQIIIPSGIPSDVVPIVGIVFGTIMIMVLGTPIIRAIIRAVERRAAPPAVPSDLNARLERIEQTVDSIAIEMERVSEAQRFLTRLQTEQRAIGSVLPQPPR